MLNHGGQLEKAKAQYPDVSEPWLDLSTGIAPWSWPVADVPDHVWQRLPESSTALCAAAAAFYGCEAEAMLAVAGSQVAIELVPECLQQMSPVADLAAVAVPRWGYAEHGRCWARAGFQLVHYDCPTDVDALLAAARVQHVVVINPNNPNTQKTPLAVLQRWQQQLQHCGGYLVVDEAFADTGDSRNSALTLGRCDNLVVLRSLGKFFGMAGLRLGFVISGAALQHSLQQRLILWGVSHPAQWLGERMLLDTDWHSRQRRRIRDSGQRLSALLRSTLLPDPMLELRDGPLFVSIFGRGGDGCAVLSTLFDFLARHGILVRLFAPQEGIQCLRIGLADDAGLERLGSALTAWQTSKRTASVTV